MAFARSDHLYPAPDAHGFAFGNGHRAYLLYEHQNLGIESDMFDVDVVPSMTQHQVIGIGLAYQLHPNVVIKAAYQNVEGNRYALPSSLSELMTEDVEPTTNFFSLGLETAF